MNKRRIVNVAVKNVRKFHTSICLCLTHTNLAFLKLLFVDELHIKISDDHWKLEIWKIGKKLEISPEAWPVGRIVV